MGGSGGRFFSPLFFRLWIPFGFAFFLGMFIGSVNSVLAPYITEEFSLTPAALGFVSSMNLAAFGIAQLPLGLMLDRFGGKVTLIVMLSFALAGTFLFGCAQNYAMLICARALIGFGFAAALMSAFKSFAHWLPQEYLPLAFSLESMMGGIGVMSATRPVTLALQFCSWRKIMFAAAAAVLIAILLLVFLAPRETANKGGQRQSLWRAAKEMFGFVTDKRFLYVAPVVPLRGPGGRGRRRSAFLVRISVDRAVAQGCRHAGGGERRPDDAAQLDGHRRRLSSERRDSQLPFQERLADVGGVLFLRGRSVHGRRRSNRLFRRPGRAALVLRDVQRDDDDDFVLDYGAAVRARRIGARLLAAQLYDFRRILPFTVVHRRDNQPVPGVRR